MASNEVEVLDPTATVENLPETASGSTLNRRHFMAALGAAGVAAAGAGLVSSSPDAQAQLPSQNGYQQSDVLNFLLNIKYLKATFYAWLTTGSDLPDALTIGSGVIEAIPQGTVKSNYYYYPSAGASKLTASSSGPITQQVLDMLTEAYYDELQQVTDLRNLLGSLAISRPTMNIQGDMQSTGHIYTTTATVTFSITQNLTLGIARLLEDLSATAFAYAAQYLSGSNLAYATQILASDSLHAGAIRLACIQGNVPYIATQYSTTTYNSSDTITATYFRGSTTNGQPTVYGTASTSTVTNTFPSVGQVVTGSGIPTNTTVIATTSPNGTTSATFTGILTKGSSTISLVDSSSGQPLNVGSLAKGQPVTGTYIPANAVISTVTGTSTSSTITIAVATAGVSTAVAASASTTVAPTGIVTSGSPIITGISSVAGFIPGQAITSFASYNGSTAGAFPTGTTITKINPDNTVTMSASASTSSLYSFTGITTSGDPNITQVTTTSGGTNYGTAGLVVGQPVYGNGFPTTAPYATIVGITTSTSAIKMSMNASVTATAASFSSPSPNTITAPTTESITIGTGSITLSANATATAYPVTITAYTADNNDVAPADNGTNSAAGPAVYLGTNPAIYQAFFNTAGTATASGGTPAGFAFARTFSQVLQVLFNGTTTQTTQVTTGGFFPSGVNGTINAV